MEKKSISSRRLFAPLRRVFILPHYSYMVVSTQMTVLAQGSTVRGTVKDAKGTSAESITVSVKGSAVGTATNKEG